MSTAMRTAPRTAPMQTDTMTVAECMAECRRMEAELRQRRPAIQVRINAITRGRDRLLHDELERVRELRQEDAEIVRHLELLKQRRIELADALDQSYERSFMLAAKELLDEPTLASIHARGRALSDARRTRAAALGVGSAVPVLGSAPGMKGRE